MSQKPIRTIESVFLPMENFLISAAVAAYCALAMAVFAVIAGGTLVGMMRLQFESYKLALIGFTPTFPLVLSWFFFKTRGSALYTIYQDRIEYVHRDLMRSIHFDQVIDVKFSQWAWQRSRGVGTVLLVVDPLKLRENNWNPVNDQIAIQNIPQPREIYELVRSLAALKKDRID